MLNCSAKRQRDFYEDVKDPPVLKLHIDDDTVGVAEVIKHQEDVISTYFPQPVRTRSIVRRPSDIIPNMKRPPITTFPHVIPGDVLISPPMPGELKWTSCMTDPNTAASVDEGRSYSNGLAKWSPVTWDGVSKLPQGTWVQYTTSVYPDYKERKKVVCTVGQSFRSRLGSLEVWSVVPSASKSTVSPHCLKGYHEPKTSPLTPFLECEHCPVKGWALSPGNPSQDRRFYVSPWVLKRIS
jgi:hypothetical protein